MFLPVKFIGMNGKVIIAECEKWYKKSSIKWEINFLNITYSLQKSICTWKSFIEWIGNKVIQITFDFQNHALFKFIITNDLKKINVMEDEQITFYIKDN